MRSRSSTLSRLATNEMTSSSRIWPARGLSEPGGMKVARRMKRRRLGATASSRVLPSVARASIAACASAARSSANVWPTVGSSRPAAASSSASALSARERSGVSGTPRTSVTPAASASCAGTNAPLAIPNATKRPPGLHEPERGGGDRAADAVEDDVDGAGARVLRPAGARVVDGDVRAERARERELALAAGGGDDARAGAARELDEQAADAAPGGEDEHGLAGLRRGRPDERQRRAPVGEQCDGGRRARARRARRSPRSASAVACSA